MFSYSTLKNPDHEKRLIHSRIYVTGIIVLLLSLMILIRVFYLQVIMHDHFTTLSQNNRVKIVPIAPIRGLIFSSDNVLLADNRSSFSLEIVPELIDDVDSTIDKIGKFIKIEPADIKRFKEQLKRKRRFESIPLRFNLSDEEVARISVNRHRFPGVDVVARLNRYYPLGNNIAHTIGYVGMIDEHDLDNLDTSNYSATSHIGKLGVEKAYEDLLHGNVGYQQVEVNAQGRVIRILDRTPPVPGKDIYLTLDVSLQNIAVQSLEGKRGAIVAIDPRNGSILALVSSPSYDPNPFVNGIDTATYKQLLQSSDSPLLNRVLQGKYPPGSTIKPFLGLAALDYGVRDLTDETRCQGWFALKGSNHRYRDWKKYGHGEMNLTMAIAQSCDVYFYSLANDLGINKVYQGLINFGFGKKTGIDIGGETAGLIPSREWKQKVLGQVWYPGETLILGIGQGSALVTPIQLANATAALANHGKLMQPHLFAEARDSISNQILFKSSVVENREIKVGQDSYWDDIIHAMVEVVHGVHGTARRSGSKASYRIAGKTGTAQVITIGQDEEYKSQELPEELRDHALFIAFAPADTPRIAVAIIVENGGSGSATAAPIARLLFDHYLSEKSPLQG